MTSSIIAIRATWGDPVDVILNDNEAIAGGPLHRVVYGNGQWEWLPNGDVNQCSANVGGDPASGCETFVNPYATDGLCVKHRASLRCGRCGGTNGTHGLVHVRHGNGGGHNRPCPLSA